MQMDPASAARRANGTFLNRHQGGAPASKQCRQHAQWGSHRQSLRLHNSTLNMGIGILLASSMLPRVGRPIEPSASRLTEPAGVAGAALLPSARAASGYSALSAEPAGSAWRGLAAIGNAVTGACVTLPNRCMPALVLGGIGAVAATAYLGSRLIMAPAAPIAGPSDAHLPARPSAEVEHDLRARVQQINVTTIEGEPESMEEALLRIARDCGGDRRCRAEAINTLLQHVGPVPLAQLQDMVARTAAWPQTTAAATGLLPGAEAAPWTGSALDTLVEALASIYTPEVAAFQDDMETIVAATLAAGGGREGGEAATQRRWVDANARRMQAIAQLLERDVGPVRHLPYPLTGLEHLAIADGTEASNLHVTLGEHRASPATRRLLLVAHGDMIGRSRGSEGAYDNASGVATLLHIARQWKADPSRSDIQVELLITSNEELGFLGARAYVTACKARDDCPTFVVNVDMAGRGGQGYALSGTEALAASPHLGKPSLYLQGPPVTAVEQQARRVLEQRLAERGFTPAPADVAPWVTSDNIAFQNASIPCVGISQVSAQDARLWTQLEAARKEWHRLHAVVDWTRWQAYRAGTLPLPDAEATSLEADHEAATAAYAHYRTLRDAHPLAPPVLIHSGRDRLHRIDPRMGVDFGDALLDGVRQLQQSDVLVSPAATTQS